MDSSTKAKVLVVDDEHLVRWSLCRHLEKQGFSACEAERGQDALRLLESEGPFQAVITDLMMPEMDGVEFIRRAKGLHPELTFLVITALDSASAMGDAVAAGALRAFPKPFDLSEISRTLQSLVA